MIVGTGTDIVEVSRIYRLVRRFGDRFAARILTERERRTDSDERQLAAYLARQFAAKEAVSKALRSGMKNGVHFRSIEVTRQPDGAPVVTLLGGALDRAGRLGITDIHVSISDEKEYALAFAVAERL